jgi:hypothetical protein
VRQEDASSIACVHREIEKRESHSLSQSSCFALGLLERVVAVLFCLRQRSIRAERRDLLKCCPTFCINTSIICIHKVRFVSSAPLGNNYNAVNVETWLFHLIRARRRRLTLMEPFQPTHHFIDGFARSTFGFVCVFVISVRDDSISLHF